MQGRETESSSKHSKDRGGVTANTRVRGRRWNRTHGRHQSVMFLPNWPNRILATGRSDTHPPTVGVRNTIR